MKEQEALELIQKRIREVRDTGAKELDLAAFLGGADDKTKERILEEVFALEQLESLDLTYNGLQTIPEAIAKLHNLTSLDLSHNYLAELPEDIGQLHNLTTLGLSSNQLKALPEAITKLQNLTSLDLSANGLETLPEDIAKLQNLTSLNLSGNKLQTLPEAITKLQNLTSLDLGANKLQTVPEAITKLHNLTSLDLRYNGLETLPEAITKLHNLTSLNLGGNKLETLPEAITKLHNLTSLNLYNNGLVTVPEDIAKLQNLTSLDLGANKLQTVPEAITKLHNLTSLDLRYNGLETLPEAITKLHNLTLLNLGGNKLETLPEAITKLHNLTSLYLYNNGLVTVPEDIAKLQNLTSLDLGANKLQTVPEAITKLHNLTSLDLGANKLQTVPEAITKLHNLTSLNLSGNKLETLPEAITKLHNLTSLNLSYSGLKTLPEAITKLHNLTGLDLRGNPLESPPEAVAKDGIQAIRDYFRQLKDEGLDHLYEAKLLILGEPGAGKTTLALKIQDPECSLPSEDDTTRGIDVTRWEFPIDDNRTFRVNIWDFGGQEIYKATHQFFLTSRSLYALVADTRKEDTDFDYWLNVVDLYGDNSPALIIKNEKGDRPRHINESQLKDRFKSLREIFATNLDTGRGLPQVLDALKQQVRTLPHIGEPLPKTWVKVREALEDDSRNHIPIGEFLSVCGDHGFKQEKDKLQLSGYLHDLGVCLHFQDDPLLKNTVILKPDWGTAAVYKVLDNPDVISNAGHFSRRDLTEIWHEDKYNGKHDELLQMMLNFKLCYEIPGCEDKFIAPQLLTEDQPDYDWDDAGNLHLRYRYEFMPKGLVRQLVVVLHEQIAEQKQVWRSGVILEEDSTKAEVIEHYNDREIRIRVHGAHKKQLMTIVTWELDRINRSFNRSRQRLVYDKLVPCTCDECSSADEPYFFEYKRLKKFESDNKESIQCYESGDPVSVRSLIDDVRSITRREKTKDQDGIDLKVTYEGRADAVERLVRNGPAASPAPAQIVIEKPRNNLLVGAVAFPLALFLITTSLVGVANFIVNNELPFNSTFLIVSGVGIALLALIITGILVNDGRVKEDTWYRVLGSDLINFPMKALELILGKRPAE